jgi:multidrug efflux pump
MRHSADAAAITNLQTRNGAGDGAAGALMKVELTFGPTRVNRDTTVSFADINGAPNQGFSSGSAEGDIEDLLKKTLPRGMTYEWTELSYQGPADT